MKLNALLGTEFPIIQGGMANIATAPFAAAVSSAGALGLIGAGGMDADTLRQHIRQCRELTDKPFGVNIMLMNPAAPEMAQVVVEEQVPVVTTGAGSPAPYMDAWKKAGIKVIPVVAAPLLAKRLESYGADAIVAEGTESGRSHIAGADSPGMEPAELPRQSHRAQYLPIQVALDYDRGWRGRLHSVDYLRICD